MTRRKYIILLNVAIANGRAAEFRQRHPSPEATPDSVYDFAFPPVPAEAVEAVVALQDVSPEPAPMGKEKRK